MAFTAGQKILDPCPLVVSQSKALHGSCVTSIVGPHGGYATVREMKEGPSRSAISC
jgi:hypothetical protein